MTREEREQAIAILENEKKCVNRANKNDYCNRDCYNCELVKTDTEILTALDMAIQALEQSMPTMVYPQVDGITPTVVAQADGEKNCFNCKWYPDNDITKGFDEVCHKCSNSDKWEGLIKRVPWEDIAPPPKIPEAQADGEKTCGTCRNEDTYHCAECENKSDYEQAQADGEITDDDIATMRILFNAEIGHFCNQGRHKDAEEMEQIRDRLMARLQADDDAISRQAVLETLDDMDNVLDEDRTIENYKELLKECYEVLPPVRPQEPCEEWYDVPSDEMTLEQARQAVKDLRKKLAKYLKQEPTATSTNNNGEMVYPQVEGITPVVVEPIPKLPSVSPQPCEDAISRQALLKLMGEEPFNWTDSNQELQAVEDYRNFRNMVEQLPSVKPQDCDTCEVGNPCLYCKNDFEPQESEE